MSRTTLIGIALSACFGVASMTTPAMAAALGPAAMVFQGISNQVTPASFWAQPYPYGYRWRRVPCVRYAPAEYYWGYFWQPRYVCR